MRMKEKSAPAEPLSLPDELEKHYWRDIGRRVLKDWRLYAMLLPLILVFLFWRYFPLYELVTAFKTSDTTVPVLERNFVGFSHFSNLMFGADSAGFWRAFRNTFLLSFYGLLFGFPVPIILALFFSEVKSNGYRSVLQVSTYLPRFVSTVVITTLVTMLLAGGSAFSQPGILAQALVKIGWIPDADAVKGLLYIPKYFRAIYLVSGVWETAGYGSIVFFAAVIGISPTSYEAARIDGATKLQQIKHVVLPGILSTITIMLILRIGELLTIGYEKVLLLYNSYTYSTADVVSTYVFQRAGIQSGATTNQSLASAADLINAVVSMLLVMGANLISRKASDTSLY
ncbi:MAG TPA: ABC transporter permease subunit [Clostridia bacterium]|nr:ABC transporter permease subunit [Clostridia bacterium]